MVERGVSLWDEVEGVMVVMRGVGVGEKVRLEGVSVEGIWMSWRDFRGFVSWGGISCMAGCIAVETVDRSMW